MLSLEVASATKEESLNGTPGPCTDGHWTKTTSASQIAIGSNGNGAEHNKEDQQQQPPLRQQQHANLDEEEKKDWIRALYLGAGLFLVLFPFWLLDSLKDPLLSRLTRNLERHQPTAKLVSVVTTLVMVCVLEYISHERRTAQQLRKQRQKQREKRDQKKWARQTTALSSSLYPVTFFQPSERSADDVLDGGGRWTRMPVHDDHNDDDVVLWESKSGVPSTIFASIGIPYCIAFGFMAYLLQFHALATTQKALTTTTTTTTTTTLDSTTNTTTLPLPPVVDISSSSSAGLSFWHVLGYVLFAAIESYGSLAVAAFWSFTNSTLSLEEAETFYGPIIAMAQLGAIGGSTLVATTQYNHVTLIVLACLFMVLHIVVMYLYTLRYKPSSSSSSLTHAPLSLSLLPPKPRQRPGVAMGRPTPMQEQRLTWRGREPTTNTMTMLERLPWLTGIYTILQHNYVLLILGASCLYDVSLTCLNYQMTLLGWDRHGGAEEEYWNDSNGDSSSSNNDASSAFTRFMGRYGQLVNLSSLLLSSLVFPWLMKHVGLRYTLRLFPTLLLLINLIAFVALPGNLLVLFVGLSLLKAMMYSIHDPSTEILYLPTAPAIQFQAKFWIDVVGARIAKAFGSTINTLSGSVHRSIRLASAPSLCTALGLWWICYRVGNQFEDLIQSGHIVGETTAAVGSNINGGGEEEQASLLSAEDYYYDDDDESEESEAEILFVPISPSELAANRFG
ncbi:hypothetical protein ACA910_019944 [Epithemia clementina (nom. ined.)]